MVWSMSNKYHFADNQVVLDTLPKKFKKMTATRFAAVLGLNRWTTPFQVWCALTYTWEPPFEDSIYTIAGKVIEPKIRDEYLKHTYFWDVENPDDVFGDGTPNSGFKKTWGDFYPNKQVFGGMWDGLGHDDQGDFILEIKTTKRAEDWLNGVPEYYKLQAALYTYLSGLDRFVVTGSFLEPKDYEDPHQFVPSTENTQLFDFSLAEEYPNFEQDYIQPALTFWNEYVEKGISPEFDEKKDAEALKALRTTSIKSIKASFKTMLNEYDKLQLEINAVLSEIQPKMKRQTELKKAIKKEMQANFQPDDKYAEVTTPHFELKMTRSTRISVDTKKLKAAGLFDDYSKQTESYTLRENLKKEGK